MERASSSHAPAAGVQRRPARYELGPDAHELVWSTARFLPIAGRPELAEVNVALDRLPDATWTTAFGALARTTRGRLWVGVALDEQTVLVRGWRVSDRELLRRELEAIVAGANERTRRATIQIRRSVSGSGSPS